MVQALLTQLHTDYPQGGLTLIGAKHSAGMSDYTDQE